MSYKYITAPELANLIKGGAKVGKDIAIVDVRDQDFEGGNIPGAINAPSEQRTEESVTELSKKLKDVPKVVFHCALSQARGPKAARIYAQELDRQALSEFYKSQEAISGSGPAFSPNPFLPRRKEGDGQEVLVLRDGFTGWQSRFRNDPELVEKFDKKIWGDYSH
ncbi:Rhodanese-like protein [Meredithblackwellia eburnea MCA 4105]